MALEIFPTDKGVGGQLPGRRFEEDKWEDIFGPKVLIPGVVLTGLDQNALVNLNFTFNTGDAVVGGFRCKGVPQTVVALPDNQNDITVWLELTKDVNGDISGVAFTTKTDFTLPTNAAIPLRFFKTVAGAVTVNYDRRPLRWTSYRTAYRGDGNAGRKLPIGFRPQFAVITAMIVGLNNDEIGILTVGNSSDRKYLLKDDVNGARITGSTGTFFDAAGIAINNAGFNVNAEEYEVVAW